MIPAPTEAYYAQINPDMTVKQVIVIDPTWTLEQATSWLNANVSPGYWVPTSTDGSINGPYFAAPGRTLDPIHQCFLPETYIYSPSLNMPVPANNEPVVSTTSTPLLNVITPG